MTPFHDDFLTSDYAESQEACAEDGARLWEPRNVDGFVSLKRYFAKQLSQTEFPNAGNGHVAFAIGMKVNGSKATYPDGSLVPSQILDQIVSWENGHPQDGELCVYLVNEKMQSLPCNGQGMTGSNVCVRVAQWNLFHFCLFVRSKLCAKGIHLRGKAPNHNRKQYPEGGLCDTI